VKRLTRDQIIYRFSREAPPVVEIDPGEDLLFELQDTSNGKVKTSEDAADIARTRNPEKVNAATGPVFVRGAVAGDTLVVDILEIHLDSQAFTRLLPGNGVLAGEVETPRGRVVQVRDGRIDFGEGISFPARPMIGVMGTAPAAGEIPNLQPGDHGGNMDLLDVTVGTRVYLPVSVPGALFALGDLHASMGDGELSGVALEAAGEVIVRIDLRKGERIARPWMERADAWITYGCGSTLEEAIRTATRDMVALLGRRLNLDREAAFMLVSATGDLRVGQASFIPGVGMTARVVMPKIRKGG
jgi:amidase